ncbi:hypothetical protein Droror1_Dr00000051 [Drosera rotundifolia]
MMGPAYGISAAFLSLCFPITFLLPIIFPCLSEPALLNSQETKSKPNQTLVFLFMIALPPSSTVSNSNSGETREHDADSDGSFVVLGAAMRCWFVGVLGCD